MLKQQNLYKIAERQQGLFTAKQAESCGYSSKHFHYYIKAGEWEREMRGIYRLTMFPAAEEDLQLMAWVLWTRGRDDKSVGVLSHETAMVLYEISDLLPSRIHMTIPPNFRKLRETPKILVLKKANLTKGEVTSIRGLPVTTIKRTFFDLVRSDTVSKDTILQSFEQACAKGLLSTRDRKLIWSEIDAA